MSKSKARGTAAETATVRWLQEHGFPYAERRAGNGSQDRGDIAGIPGVVAEVKNCSRDALPAWVDEAKVEAANAGVDIGLVIHKRRGTTDCGRWFATMDLETLARLIQ